VPPGVKLAFTARHFLNMRQNFPPTAAYSWLKTLALSFKAEDVFVWTSNVDGCFERAGFDPAHVYTTQGEMNKYQCAMPGCHNVWNCIDQLRAIDAAATNGVLDDLSLAPTCTKCGSQWPAVRPNLRGGDWFEHKPYEEVQQRLLEWLDRCVHDRARVGHHRSRGRTKHAGGDEIPACAFASAVKANGGEPVYLRINPDHPEGPRENPATCVPFYRWQESWTALKPLVDAVLKLRRSAPAPNDTPAAAPHKTMAQWWQQRYYDILLSLRTPRA